MRRGSGHGPSVRLGRRERVAAYFAGSLDEVAMYTSVLPAATIQNHNLSGR
jgi:hypothetical protein